MIARGNKEVHTVLGLSRIFQIDPSDARYLGRITDGTDGGDGLES